MDIALTVKSQEVVRVLVNGTLGAEIVACDARSVADWEAELVRARCAMSLRGIVSSMGRTLSFAWEDHINTTPDKRRTAYAEGLLDGMLGRFAEAEAGSLLPPLPLRHDISYRYGFDRGEAMQRAAAMSEGRQP